MDIKCLAYYAIIFSRSQAFCSGNDVFTGIDARDCNDATGLRQSYTSNDPDIRSMQSAANRSGLYRGVRSSDAPVSVSVQQAAPPQLSTTAGRRRQRQTLTSGRRDRRMSGAAAKYNANSNQRSAEIRSTAENGERTNGQSQATTKIQRAIQQHQLQTQRHGSHNDESSVDSFNEDVLSEVHTK